MDLGSSPPSFASYEDVLVGNRSNVHVLFDCFLNFCSAQSSFRVAEEATRLTNDGGARTATASSESCSLSTVYPHDMRFNEADCISALRKA